MAIIENDIAATIPPENIVLDILPVGDAKVLTSRLKCFHIEPFPYQVFYEKF